MVKSNSVGVQQWFYVSFIDMLVITVAEVFITIYSIFTMQWVIFH